MPYESPRYQKDIQTSSVNELLLDKYIEEGKDWVCRVKSGDNDGRKEGKMERRGKSDDPPLTPLFLSSSALRPLNRFFCGRQPYHTDDLAVYPFQPLFLKSLGSGIDTDSLNDF